MVVGRHLGFRKNQFTTKCLFTITSLWHWLGGWFYLLNLRFIEMPFNISFYCYCTFDVMVLLWSLGTGSGGAGGCLFYAIFRRLCDCFCYCNSSKKRRKWLQNGQFFMTLAYSASTKSVIVYNIKFFSCMNKMPSDILKMFLFCLVWSYELKINSHTTLKALHWLIEYILYIILNKWISQNNKTNKRV